MDRMQATPRIRPFVGGLADMLTASYSPHRTQHMQGLMRFLQVPDAAQTLDRISYGEPITTGAGMTTSLRPEAKNTLAMLLGLVPIGRAAEPAAVATGRALEPVVGRVAEAAYDRGGLAREMAMAMGQGTQSQAVRRVGQPDIKALQDEYYEATAKANELYGMLRGGNRDPKVLEEYKQVSARRESLMPQMFPKEPETPPASLLESVGDYRGQHSAPTRDSGAPLWKLDDIYPDDFYSAQGVQYYGSGSEPMRDASVIRQLQSLRGRPNAPVTIYRAVPKSVDSKQALNPGDWVTTDRQYAKEHGIGALSGDYKIVRKNVKAKDLFTNADSIYEIGYDPQAMIRRK
jgi:hypothetical protein